MMATNEREKKNNNHLQTKYMSCKKRKNENERIAIVPSGCSKDGRAEVADILASIDESTVRELQCVYPGQLD